jgi:ribose transport system substrate-binding protein
MSSRLLFIAVGVLAVGVIAATSIRRIAEPTSRSGPPPKILFVTGGDSPYWKLTIAGARSGASDHGADLTVVAPVGGTNQQIEALRKSMGSSVDGVALSPMDTIALTPVLDEFSAQAKIVTFDSDAPGSKRLCFIGADNYSAGRLCARLVREALPDGGKVVLFVPNAIKNNSILRQQGFRDELAAHAQLKDGDAVWELSAVMEDGIDAGKCAANLEAAFGQDANLRSGCAVGMFAYHGAAFLSAIEKNPALSNLKYIVFDEDETTLDAVATGTFHATVVQDPFKFGYESVRMLVELVRGHDMELPIAGSGSLFVPCEAIHSSEVAAFRARLAKRLQQP